MTDARILFPEFRDEQADSKYPFADTATLVSSSGAVSLGSDTFLDATLFPVGAGAGLYISAITVTAQNISIAIGDSNTPSLITTTFATAAAPADGVLPFFDAYGRPAGMLLSSPLNLGRLTTWPPGTYTFTRAATEFVATVCIPANEPGVRGILTPAGQLLAGDVWLVGDAGVVIRGEGESNIRVDVIGVPLFKRFVCEPLDDFPAKNYLRTINGCGPDQFGNFTITATGQGVKDRTDNAKDDTVLRVYPQDGTIVFDAVGRSLK